MKLGYVFTLLAVVALSTSMFSGCDDGKVDAGHSHKEGEHHDDHDEDSLPAHGPNNGHLFRLEGTDMVGEWIHYSSNDIIRVVLLDETRTYPVDYDGVSITPKAGDDQTPFVLELDTEKNPEGEKKVYMLDEKRLMHAMSLGVDVEMTVGDKKYTGKIEPHAHHDH